MILVNVRGTTHINFDRFELVDPTVTDRRAPDV